MASTKRRKPPRSVAHSPSRSPSRSAAAARSPSGSAAGSASEARPETVEPRDEKAPSPSWIEPLLSRARRNGKARAAALRIQRPNDTSLQLARRLVSGAAFKAGLWGAATGALAIITLPVGLPAGVAVTLLLEAELLFALLALYGFSSAGEVGRVRLFALWAGSGFDSAATNAGLKVGANAASRALAGSLPARLIARINPVLLKAILARLGLSWLPKVFKLWPVIGAPIGFMLDRAALRSLGAQAVEALERAPRPQVRTPPTQ